MSANILIINDPHVAASPPANCNDIYTDDVFNMLEECREIARAKFCQSTVFTGDFFHDKRNVPHWLVRRCAELLLNWPCERLAIVGNHDQSHRGLASIERQPIGVLFETGALTWLKEDVVREYLHKLVLIDGWQFEGQELPPQSPLVRVQWSPANYFDEIDDDPANFSLERRDDVDWAIKVAHGSLVKSDRDYPAGFRVVQMKDVPTAGMDACLFGHLHNDSGIHEVNDCMFVGLGSIGRVASAEYNYTRKVRVALMSLTSTEMTFTPITLKSQVAPEVLFKEKVLASVETDDAMKRFARDMEKALAIEEMPLEEVLAKVTGKGVEPEVKKLVRLHLEEAGLNA